MIGEPYQRGRSTLMGTVAALVIAASIMAVGVATMFGALALIWLGLQILP